VSAKIWTDETREIANRDFQFRNATRWWSFALMLQVGDDKYILDIVEGEIRRFERTEDQFQSYSAILGGTVADWENLLEMTPPPFYQDFFGAWFQHGFTIAGDLHGLFAHYWALLRLLDVMREVAAREGATV
jgi:hypothetical protein